MSRIEALETEVAKLNSDLSGSVLWNNPNPTVAFPAQVVTLDDDTYAYYEVIAKFKTTYDVLLSCRLERGHFCYCTGCKNNSSLWGNTG